MSDNQVKEFRIGNNRSPRNAIQDFTIANRLGGNAPQIIASKYGYPIEEVTQYEAAAVDEEVLNSMISWNANKRLLTVLNMSTYQKVVCYIPDELFEQGYTVDNVAGGYADGAFNLFRLANDGSFEPVKRGTEMKRLDYIGTAGIIMTDFYTTEVAYALIHGEM